MFVCLVGCRYNGLPGLTRYKDVGGTVQEAPRSKLKNNHSIHATARFHSRQSMVVVSIIHHLSSVIHRLSSVIRHLSSIVHRIHRPSRPSSIVHRPSLGIHCNLLLVCFQNASCLHIQSMLNDQNKITMRRVSQRLQKVFAAAASAGRDGSAVVWDGAEYLEFLLQVFAEVHDGGDVAATVAVVGGGPDSHDVFVLEVVLRGASGYEGLDQKGRVNVPCNPR
jgi:hypothetical protein